MRISVGALFACLSAAGAGGVAQTHPDLSGHWVLVGASGSPTEIAQTLTIQQTVVDKNASGGPMAPYVSALSVSRDVDGVVHTETLKVGMEGGVIGGVAPPVSATSERPEARSFWSVRWRDDCLIIYSESYSSITAAGQSMTRTEQWCLNAAGHLVVTVRGSQPDNEATTAMRVYKKQ
jgi:hypothetical protein